MPKRVISRNWLMPVGYLDQARLTRDIRKLAGKAADLMKGGRPGAFLALNGDAAVDGEFLLGSVGLEVFD